MNFSRPFIERPVGTTLLSIGLMILGIISYFALPVSSLPAVDFPSIHVNASRPGADPATMAASVAAPLERRLSTIPGVIELTSSSTLGSTGINIQFDLTRNIDAAARDVQAALNAAATDLPGDLPSLPSFHKANPAAAPILLLALTSDTLPASALYDVADSVIAQRIAQVEGVAEVNVSGAEQPAVRVRVNPALLSQLGISMEEVRLAIANTNSLAPIGNFDNADRAVSIATNAQLTKPEDYDPIVVKTVGGNVIRLVDVASVEAGPRNTRSAAYFNDKPSVILFITKQPDANVLATVDRVKALLPEIKRWIPASVEFNIFLERTTTIRSSINDMLLTLSLSVLLVMMVVYVFLRRATPTLAAGITVPLSLAGTLACMWLVGFSIDNLSLMALAVSVGFVVDDAIVMIENMYRNLEAGMSPKRAAIEGARQIGFTVLSISLSLVAAFIPLIFMTGVVGRLLREFSMTLVFAIVVSTIVSLTVTPMITAHLLRRAPDTSTTAFDRFIEGGLDRLLAFYRRTLLISLNHSWFMLVLTVAAFALTVALYIKTPKGYFPQDDAGFLFASTEASPEISFPAMADLQAKAAAIISSDPAVANIGSSVGGGGSVNLGRIFIVLKPLKERDGLSSAKVVDRMREKLNKLHGINVYMVAAQDIRAGARQGKSQYQLTLWDPNVEELYEAVPKVLAKLRAVPGLVDVSTDREQGGLQANVIIDRVKAARLGVTIANIDAVLNDAFSQRQVTTIYAQRNQYRVILEVDPRYQRDPSDLTRVYVTGAGHTQVPLSSLVRIEKGLAPLVVNHQGQFPAVTITYALTADMTLDEATAGIDLAIASLGLAETVHVEAAGDAKSFSSGAGAQPLLIGAALLAVYIVLGVLYESLAHPLTIISTLPSAGLGALISLQVAGMELSIIALIGIILLIGIVKKNGIMLVDFALEAERERGASPRDAIFEACMARFRPILMTTLAALFGAIPLAVATGIGSELRRPLGVTIIGGLIVSQVLTLYTTPAIYLLLDRLHHWLSPRRLLEQTLAAARPAPAPSPSPSPGE